MNWFSTALLSATLHAGVNIVDSHILSRRMLGLRTFMLGMAVIQIFYGLVLYLISPWNIDISGDTILWLIANIVFSTSGSLIVLFVLRREEVSRVIPVTYVSPVFVAVIAILFLDESLTWLHWMAVFIVVAGAVMLSLEKSHPDSPRSLKKPFMLLFLASFLGAIGSICTKQVLKEVSFLNMYSMAILGTALIYLSISLRPGIIRKWRGMKQRNATMSMVLLNEIVALSAALLYVRAISLGPVSLVSTVMGTRPVLVVIFSMILHLVLPGFLIKLPGKRTMIFRILSIAMIAGGLSIISLS